jgi:hypothetical protein
MQGFDSSEFFRSLVQASELQCVVCVFAEEMRI